MKKNYFIGFFLLFFQTFFSQNIGDIAFTGYQSDNPDKFSIVAINTLPQGSSIFITDCGIKADDTFRSSEGVMKWTLTSEISIGTEIVFDSTSGTWVASTGDIEIAPGFSAPAFTTNGDQIIMFVSDEDSDPLNSVNHFITAINFENDWAADSTDTATSKIPNGLTNGVNAVTVNPGWDNAYLDCADLPEPGTTLEEIRVSLSTVGTWQGSNSIIENTIPSGCDYNVILGIDSLEKMHSIDIYPNPTRGKLYTHNSQYLKKIEVYNVLGKLVSNGLNISNQPNGIYILKISTENSIITKKVVKY